LVWENVPGVLSSNGGLDFASLLRGMGELGYGFAYRVLDAQYFGVAQRRRRVFVVGYLGDWRPAAAVLFERHSLSGNPAPRREKREEVAGTIAARFGISRNNHEECVTSRAKGFYESGFAQYQQANVGGTIKASGGVLGGGSETFLTQPSYGIQGNMIGRSDNAGPNGIGVTEDVSFTLTKGDQHAVAHAFKVRGGCKGGGKGYLGSDDVAFTLSTIQDQQVAQPKIVHGTQDPCVSDIAFAQGRNNGGENVLVQPIGTDLYNGNITGDVAATMGTPGSSVNASGPTVMQAMAVRRLTPIECERLQGFPDNYTDIQSKGKPTPDGPRYKALGNSMAVPVMRWIGERIQKFEEMA